MAAGPLNDQQVADYHDVGYVIARDMFDSTEIDLLRRSAKDDRAHNDHAMNRADGEGGHVRVSLWNHPGNGIYGMFARCHTIVDSMEKLLGGEVYHYHSKIIMKDPKVGGAWTWHQDFGYWYQNGILWPLMASVVIAVDPATKENGCMQVLRGSHHCGRFSHVRTGQQAGADMEPVNELKNRVPLDYCQLEPGDAMFFHCNLLHRSDANKSDKPRWAMICCYNAARNDPYKDSHHPRYTPLDKVPDSRITEVGVTRIDDEATDPNWMALPPDGRFRYVSERSD